MYFPLPHPLLATSPPNSVTTSCVRVRDRGQLESAWVNPLLPPTHVYTATIVISAIVISTSPVLLALASQVCEMLSKCLALRKRYLYEKPTGEHPLSLSLPLPLPLSLSLPSLSLLRASCSRLGRGLVVWLLTSA